VKSWAICRECRFDRENSRGRTRSYDFQLIQFGEPYQQCKQFNPGNPTWNHRCRPQSGQLKTLTKAHSPTKTIMVSHTHDQGCYQDRGRRKQRTHLHKEAENVVDNFSQQLYELRVGLGLCTRDIEFKRTLQTTKRGFNELLNIDERSREYDLE
jgi:hypothetical protein